MEQDRYSNIVHLTDVDKINILRGAINYLRDGADEKYDNSQAMCQALDSQLRHYDIYLMDAREYAMIFPEYTRARYIRKNWYRPFVLLNWLAGDPYWDELTYKTAKRRIEFLTNIVKKYIKNHAGTEREIH